MLPLTPPAAPAPSVQGPIVPFAEAKMLALQEDCRMLLDKEQRYAEELRVFKQQMLDSPERQKLDEQYILQRKDLCQIMARTSERYDLGWDAAHLGMALLHAYMATEHSTGTNIELAAMALFAVSIESLAKWTTPALKLSELTDDWNFYASEEHTLSLGGGPAELRLPWQARAHAIAAKQVQICNALQWRLFGATANVFLNVFMAMPMRDATDKRMIFIDATDSTEETSVTEADWKQVRGRLEASARERQTLLPPGPLAQLEHPVRRVCARSRELAGRARAPGHPASLDRCSHAALPCQRRARQVARRRGACDEECEPNPKPRP